MQKKEKKGIYFYMETCSGEVSVALGRQTCSGEWNLLGICSGEKRVRKKREMKCVILRRNALYYVEIRRNALDYDKMHKRVEIRGFTLLWGCNVARGKQSCSGETKLLGGEKLKVARGRQCCSGAVALSCSKKMNLLSGAVALSCSEKVNLLWGEKACFRIILNICTGEDDIVLSGCKLVLKQAFSGEIVIFL